VLAIYVAHYKPIGLTDPSVSDIPDPRAQRVDSAANPPFGEVHPTVGCWCA